jgi:DME family drug/metabolite transporter
MRSRRHRHGALGPLAIVGAAVLFGTTGTAQELGPDTTSPLGVGAVRILLGAIALWVIDGALPRFDAFRRDWQLLLVGAAGVALYQPGFFTGTERLGVALGTIVALGSGPVFAGLIDAATGRRPSAAWAGATAFAITGGSLLVLSGESGSDFDLLGLAGSLGAGLGYATYATVTKRLIVAGTPSTEASAWQFSIGALALAPLVIGEPMGWLGSAGGWLMALHLGIMATGVAYLLYGFGLRTVDASTATTITLAEPVTAAILAVAVLDERLRWFGWVGAGLVLLGLLILGGRGMARTSR